MVVKRSDKNKSINRKRWNEIFVDKPLKASGKPEYGRAMRKIWGKIKKIPQKTSCIFCGSMVVCILLSYDFQKEVTS